MAFVTPEACFALAALISAIWCGVHLIVGGSQIAAPLLATEELNPITRDVQYLCWHFTSVTIAAMAGFFVLAILFESSEYAVAGTVLSAAFSLVGIALVTLIGQKHSNTPQGWLFVPVAALGVAGLLLQS